MKWLVNEGDPRHQKLIHKHNNQKEVLILKIASEFITMHLLITTYLHYTFDTFGPCSLNDDFGAGLSVMSFIWNRKV